MALLSQALSFRGASAGVLGHLFQIGSLLGTESHESSHFLGKPLWDLIMQVASPAFQRIKSAATMLVMLFAERGGGSGGGRKAAAYEPTLE